MSGDVDQADEPVDPALQPQLNVHVPLPGDHAGRREGHGVVLRIGGETHPPDVEHTQAPHGSTPVGTSDPVSGLAEGGGEGVGDAPSVEVVAVGTYLEEARVHATTQEQVGHVVVEAQTEIPREDPRHGINRQVGRFVFRRGLRHLTTDQAEPHEPGQNERLHLSLLVSCLFDLTQSREKFFLHFL